MSRRCFRVAGTTRSPPCAGSAVVVALRVVGLRVGRSRRVADRVALVVDRADLVVRVDRVDRAVVGRRVVALLP